MMEMPNPDRLVRRSISICKKRGLSDTEAKLLISMLALEVFVTINADSDADPFWMRQVLESALRQLANAISADRQSGR